VCENPNFELLHVLCGRLTRRTPKSNGSSPSGSCKCGSLRALVAHYCSNYCNYWHYFTIFNFFVITEFSHYSGGASRARLPPSNLLHVRFVLVSTGKTIFLNIYCPRRFYAFFPTISNLTSQSNPFLTMVKPVIHHIKQQSNGLIIHHYNKTTTAVSMVYRFFTMGCIFHWMSTK